MYGYEREEGRRKLQETRSEGGFAGWRAGQAASRAASQAARFGGSQSSSVDVWFSACKVRFRLILVLRTVAIASPFSVDDPCLELEDLSEGR